MAVLAAGSSVDAAAIRMLKVPDCALYYRIQGRGKAVLLLAGGPGHAGDYLAAVFEHISATRMAILLDQRGTGRSVLQAVDPTTITLEKAIDDLERLRVELGVERWALFGHSWGGMLAMAYTAAHPERVDELMLIGSGGVSLESHGRIGATLEARLTPAERDAIRRLQHSDPNDQQPQTAVEIKRLLWNAYVYDPHSLAAISARLTSRTYSAEVASIMLANLKRTKYDLRGRLKLEASTAGSFRGRVLLLYGNADAWGQGTAPELVDVFPRAVVNVISHSGHFPWVESPHEFYRSLDRFLEHSVAGTSSAVGR